MPQHEIEVILMRQLASYLAMPVLILDPKGNLVFFNEPAEPILGRRFEETGEIRREDWNELFRPTEQDGTEVKAPDGPLMRALLQREPNHRRFWIQGLDGVAREIEGIALPLTGQGDRNLGVVGIFWEFQKP